MALLDYFENIIPKNTNIFGATQPSYLNAVATQDQLEAAKNQSLFQGLLGMGVGYLAQPKNQGYGSAIPYLAKSYLQGMQMAQSPYQQLEKDILMKQKFDQIALEQQQKKDMLDLQGKLYINKPAVTQTVSDYSPIKQISPSGEAAIAPSFKPYNAQDIVVSPAEKTLNTQALMDYAIKYPAQGGQFVDVLTKVDELNRPKGTRQLTTLEKTERGLPLNIEYQINKEGSVSPIGGTDKIISYGVEADREATRYGFSSFDKADKETKIKILDKLALTDKEKAALMGGITTPQFGTSGQTEIDKQFLVNAAELQRYDSIAKQFNPSYMTWETQAKAATLAGLEKAGRTLTPSEANLVAGYTQFKTSTLQQLNDYIVKITGAAIGQGEEEKRLKASVPNADDSATQFKAKLDLLTKDVKKAQARLYYLKTKGYKNLEQGFKDIKLDDMPQIMAQREKELIEQYAKDKNLEENPQIKGAIARQLAAEFGLSY